MNPYRQMRRSLPDVRSGWTSEEWVLYGLLVAIGAIPVAIAVARGGVFGAEPTLGLVMLCLGVFGAVFHVRRAGSRMR